MTRYNTRVNWPEEIPKIRELGEKGTTITALAAMYGVSKQRVNQILQKLLPEWKDNLGLAAIRKQRAGEYYSKWGVKDDSELYAAKRAKFRGKKANAARIGADFSLTFGEIVWPTHCPILGMELDYFAEGRQENSVSFDCLDPHKGYVPGNVKIMSWRANRIKNDGTAEEHHKIAQWLDSLSVNPLD